MRDLHRPPNVRDSWSFLYLEHCRVDQEGQAIAAHDASGKTPIPCASLNTLLLGPGTTVTHAAMRALALCGCSVLWVGEQGVRTYAAGTGETRSSRNLLAQVRTWANPTLRLAVVRRMYEMRFAEPVDGSLTLEQLRGREGLRVRAAYARASETYGIVWQGRSYERNAWANADPVNRALSAANSCLYGICHAAIVAAGYSPALGFIHTGKQLSFVYDIADLYKADMTIPAAFAAVAESAPDMEGRVRRACRDQFHRQRLLAHIVDDIAQVLAVGGPAIWANESEAEAALDEELALPGGIWAGGNNVLPGGVNYDTDGASGGEGSGEP